jgi:hypothetical protein
MELKNSLIEKTALRNRLSRLADKIALYDSL